MEQPETKQVVPSSSADFVLNTIKLIDQNPKSFYEKQMALNAEKPLCTRLNIIATELTRIEKEIEKINTLFAPRQHIFSTDDAEKLNNAKDIYQKINQRKLDGAKQKLTDFFKSNPNERNLTTINLSTDCALDTVNANTEDAKAKLANKSLRDFHNDVLHTRIEYNQLRFQHIFLAEVNNAFKDAGKDDISQALRQLASIGNTRMVKECLNRGGDPFQKGEKSGFSAIDRAREKGFEELAVLMENFKAHNTLNS